jgi:hypothetical protein
MTFKNIHHQHILRVLKALNSNLLEMNFAYFGGGTVIAKAQNAYEVIRPLKDAIVRFQSQPEWRFRCYEILQIQADIIPRIINGLDCLATDLGLEQTQREFKEQNPVF